MKNLIGVCDANEKDCQPERQWRLEFAKNTPPRIDIGTQTDAFHRGRFSRSTKGRSRRAFLSRPRADNDPTANIYRGSRRDRPR